MKKMKSFLFPMVVSVTFLLTGSCSKMQESSKAPSAATDTSGAGQMIRTPQGLAPASRVHYIEPGYHLSLANGRVLQIHNQTGETFKDFGERLTGIHNSTPMRANAFRQKSLPSSPPPASGAVPGNAIWITYASWPNNTAYAINSFTTTWVVPSAPTTNHGQILFIFDAMEDFDGNILQPVLQWGADTKDGGGAYWTVANWYVWTDAGGNTQQAVQLPLTTVTPGTTLHGVMTMGTPGGDGSNTYTSAFTGVGPTLTVAEGTRVANKSSAAFPFIDQQVEAYETIEAYGSATTPPAYATDYPPDYDVRMTGIQITNAAGNVSLNWTPTNVYTNYGQRTLVVSNASPGGEVDLYFRNPLPVPVPTITSLGKRPMGGAIGGIIVYFTLPTSSTYYTPASAFSWTARVTNTRLGSYVIIPNIYGGSPLFVNPPSGSVTGDNITVQISTVYTIGTNTWSPGSAYSNTMSITL
jgi:hypothetical protein